MPYFKVKKTCPFAIHSVDTLVIATQVHVASNYAIAAGAVNANLVNILYIV